MIKILYILFFSFIYLFGFVDDDFDGVDDSIDRCPNTSFKYIVDESGCPKDSLYFGEGFLEIIYNKQKDYNATYDIYTTYNYNNILIDISKDISQSSKSYFDIGYRISSNHYSFKNYIGGSSSGDKFILSTFLYCFTNNFYSSFLIQYNNPNEDNSNNYYNYNLSLGYIRNKHNVEFSYINSGSYYKTIGFYEAIDILYIYKIKKLFYIKLGYTPSIVDDSYSSYIGLGVGFD